MKSLDEVRDEVHHCARSIEGLAQYLDNIEAAHRDGVRWVAKDNAGWLRERARDALVAVARLYGATEQIEDDYLRIAIPTKGVPS